MTRRTVIITGAGSGIGSATACRLARSDHALVLVGRRASALRDATAQAAFSYGDAEAPPILSIPIDITEEEAPKAIVSQTLERFGRLDGLVNNAGLAELCEIPKSDRALLERTFAVNTFASALLIAEAWNALHAAPDGVVVQVTSMAAADPFPGFFVYGAAKAAAESFVRSIRNESPTLRAYAVAPGATETPMLRALFGTEVLPLESAATPESVAEVICDCVTGEGVIPSGSVIRLGSIE